MEPEPQDEPASGRFGVDEGGIIIEVLYRYDTGLEIPDEGGMASEPSSASEDAVTPESPSKALVFPGKEVGRGFRTTDLTVSIRRFDWQSCGVTAAQVIHYELEIT